MNIYVLSTLQLLNLFDKNNFFKVINLVLDVNTCFNFKIPLKLYHELFLYTLKPFKDIYYKYKVIYQYFKPTMFKINTETKLKTLSEHNI